MAQGDTIPTIVGGPKDPSRSHPAIRWEAPTIQPSSRDPLSGYPTIAAEPAVCLSSHHCEKLAFAIAAESQTGAAARKWGSSLTRIRPRKRYSRIAPERGPPRRQHRGAFLQSAFGMDAPIEGVFGAWETVCELGWFGKRLRCGRRTNCADALTVGNSASAAAASSERGGAMQRRRAGEERATRNKRRAPAGFYTRVFARARGAARMPWLESATSEDAARAKEVHTVCATGRRHRQSRQGRERQRGLIADVRRGRPCAPPPKLSRLPRRVQRHPFSGGRCPFRCCPGSVASGEYVLETSDRRSAARKRRVKTYVKR